MSEGVRSKKTHVMTHKNCPHDHTTTTEMKEVDAKRVKTSSAAFFQYVDDHKQEYIDRLKDAVLPPLQHRSRSPRSCISEACTAAPARTASGVYWAWARLQFNRSALTQLAGQTVSRWSKVSKRSWRLAVRHRQCTSCHMSTERSAAGVQDLQLRALGTQAHCQ